jgi:hypothetical protein
MLVEHRVDLVENVPDSEQLIPYTVSQQLGLNSVNDITIMTCK